MLAGDIPLNLSGRGGYPDRQMNRVLRNIVQNRTDDNFPDLVEMIVADNNEPAPETVKEVEQSNQEVKNDTSAPSGEDPVQDWYAEEGQNLKALLTKWSEESGWRLVWNTNRNYVLNAGAMFRGRFADVSSALIRAFARARPAPIATFYKGNRVLVVETMEDENAYD